ncbi:hypothetical protein ACFLXI_09760 [Chloroflexota bacterium]
MSLKAAQNGGRVIVAVNNPILRLLIELGANPPTQEQSRTVLSALAALRVRDDRIELHIQALYQTTCPNCEREINAEAFLWERKASEPHARIIRCNYCGTAGEFPLTMADIQRANQFSVGGLHRARALGRIAPPDDPDRIHVEEALNVYPPRAVYALLTLVNKLDQLNLSTGQIKILMAMLLSAFDQANTLWPYPIARDRPKQLTIPPIYLENNIWLALEAAIDLWEFIDSSIPITHWPELPPTSGGICLFDGRMKELADKAAEIQFSAVLTAFPRPNQAFWSLSALWAGWLWGHEAAEHFKPVLRRRRYDWAWHCTATHAAIKSLISILTEDANFWGLIGEAEPGYISAVTIAGAQAGLKLSQLLIFSDKKIAHTYWKISQSSENYSTSKIQRTDAIRTAARDYLRTRGEPSRFIQIHSAILAELGQRELLSSAATPAENYHQLQQEIQETLNYRNGFLRFGGSSKSLDVGWWWLADDSEHSQPLSDQVEKDVVQYLLLHPYCSFADVESALIKSSVDGEFDGQLIPDLSLIGECLESYGEHTMDGWHLKDQDTPTMRRQEIGSMVDLITELGNKLGFRVQTQEEESPYCIWLEQHDSPRYAFYFSASALLGKFLLKIDPTPASGILVLPGGRANLVMFKLGKDPRLQKLFERRWTFLKYRHARQLANNSTLTADNLESQLGLDLLTYSETQLRMF